MTFRWPLTSQMLMSHVQLNPMIIVPNSHSDTSKNVETVTISQKPTDTGMTPVWPLTHFGWGHMCDRPRIIVPKSHENILKYVDTATIFPKLWLKSQWSRWPLGDLWPFVVTCATQPQDFCTYIHGPSNYPRTNFTRNLGLTWL